MTHEMTRKPLLNMTHEMTRKTTLDVPSDIIRLISLYLDAISSIMLKSTSRYMYNTVEVSKDFYDLDERYLRNINDDVLERYNHIEKLDVSHCISKVSRMQLLNLIWLKASIRRRESLATYAVNDLISLRIIENVLIEGRDNTNYNMLVMIYNDLMFREYHRGMIIGVPMAKPHVLIMDIDDNRTYLCADKSNVQIYQIIDKYRDTEFIDAAPHVLIMKSFECSFLMELTYNGINMSKLKCMVHVIYCNGVMPSHYIDRGIETILQNAPNLEELYIVAVNTTVYADVELDTQIRQHKNIKYIRIITADTNNVRDELRYSTLIFKRIIDDYKPSILDKIDILSYRLNMYDIYHLYKHFDIPISAEMLQLFKDLNIHL